MKMESQRKPTTPRRTSTPSSATAVQRTRIRMGGVKGGRGTGMNVITEPEICSKNHIQAVELPKQLEVESNGKRVASPRNSDSENTQVTIAKNNGQLQAREQQLQESCSSDSTESKMMRSTTLPNTSPPPPIQLLNKTRSEPLEAGSSSESWLKKTISDKWDHNAAAAAQSRNLEINLTFCDSDHDGQQQGLIDKAMGSDKFQDQVIDYSVSSKEASEEDGIEVVKKKVEEQELSASVFSVINVCETEKKVQASSEEQKVIITTSDHMDNGDGVKNESEQSKLIGKPDDNCGSDQLNEVDVSQKFTQIKSKRMLSPSATKINPTSTPSPFPSTSTAARCKPVLLGRRSVGRPTSRSPSPQSTTRKASFNNSFKRPETHGKLQFLVDIVMWRDVSRSAFIFGIGTFIILSSSYAEDFNFSLISVASYLTLVYLAVVFLCKSIVSRGVIDDGEVLPENYIWGEDEAIWFVKMVLPYLNESLLKLRVLFSGDPAITMKVATLLFILARCGSSITVWKLVKLGFFGVFIIPKLCSSYSAQIITYGKFWAGRFQDAWKSCLHKKALAFVVFTVVWNFSSVVARVWAAFMLFVAFRYYHHQYIMSQDDFGEGQIGLDDVHIRRHSARQRSKVSTSFNQIKEKKSF